MSVKRFYDPGDWMQSPTGEYVLFSDHAAAIAALTAERDELKEAIRRQGVAAISGMNAAKQISSHQLETARRLHAESSPDALESERAMNATLTAEIASLEARVTELDRFNTGLATESHGLQGTVRRLEGERDALKLQAQGWAQEARTQRATVHAAYQVCTGATGEPGDWNGAEPIRKLAERIASREARNEALEATLGMAHAELTDHGHQELPECECRIAYVLRTALAADKPVAQSKSQQKRFDALAADKDRST